MLESSLIFFDYTHAQRAIIESLLYSRGYILQTIQKVVDGQGSEALLAYKNSAGEDLERDIFELFDKAHLDSVILLHDGFYTHIKGQGSRIELEISTDQSSGGDELFFVIKERPLFFSPKKLYKDILQKEELIGEKMVQIFNQNRWQTMIIENLDEDWNNIYKLFAKYNKLRLPL